MHKGEIWLVEFPAVSVHEQIGTRPVIILANTETNVCIVIPLTSNLNSLRFTHTIEIKKSEKNRLESDSIALIFQTRAIDKRRIMKRLGVLEEKYINQIDENIIRLFRLRQFFS